MSKIYKFISIISIITIFLSVPANVFGQQGQLATAQQGLGQFLPAAQRADITTLGSVGGIQQS